MSKYYKEASDKGCIESMYEYGYSLAFVISYKPKEATKYYKMAIDRGYSSAISDYNDALPKCKEKNSK